MAFFFTKVTKKILISKWGFNTGAICHTPFLLANIGFIKEVPEYKLDLLDSLRKDYKLYLLSNTNPIIMDWATGPLFSSRKKPLDQYFDKMYLSYNIGKSLGMKTYQPENGEDFSDTILLPYFLNRPVN